MRVVFAERLLGPQLFQVHVQLEDFFQEIGRHDLFLQFAGGASLFRGLFRLLFEFDAFQRNRYSVRLIGSFRVR